MKRLDVKQEPQGHSIPCDYTISGTTVGGSFYLLKAFHIYNETHQSSVHIKIGYGAAQDAVENRIRCLFDTLNKAGAMPFDVVVVHEACDY